MKIKVLTQNQYLFNKLNQLNHNNSIDLEKQFLSRRGFKKLINSINKNNKNIRLNEDNKNIYIEKLNKELKINVYKMN